MEEKFSEPPKQELFEFAESKGFTDQLSRIRSMKFKWHGIPRRQSYTDAVPKGEVFILLTENNLLDEYIDNHWPDGRSDKGQKFINHRVKLAKEHREFTPGEMVKTSGKLSPKSGRNVEDDLPQLNQILYGPPGTGKTYETTKIAVRIADPEWFKEKSSSGNGEPPRTALKQRYDELMTEGRIVFTTFHQSFSYEDFIEGIRAGTDEHGAIHYLIQDGVFKQLCDVSDADEDGQPCVLIVDEINRGNISRIFGELITLLEPAKRKGGEDAREVILPYSKEPFSVPDNVYVIGTMNTADKSLAQLDLALRRRFNFVELPPNPSLLSDVRVYGINVGAMLDVINQRIEVLLDRDHLIGHSYFLPLKMISDAAVRERELQRIFEKQIVPLLQEYFFDDWQRISWVLNDNAKAKSDRFVRSGGTNSRHDLFSADIADQINDRRFYVNTAAFSLASAYIGILSGNPGAAAKASVLEVETAGA